MKDYYYDLHIHSCLSPCGDDDSTPDSIAGMGELNGLSVMALCDHNTCKNCPAFFEAAKQHGILPVAGMELTTGEDIHLICLFPDLKAAMDFDRAVDKKRIRIKNKTEIFGNQLIMDSCDGVIGQDEFLLPNATTLSLEEVPYLADRFGGICYPAHIDREANGIIAVLGTFPSSPDFCCFEVKDREKTDRLIAEYGLQGKKVLINSDAHTLWDIKEAGDTMRLPEISSGAENAGEAVIRYLRGKS